MCPKNFSNPFTFCIRFFPKNYLNRMIIVSKCLVIIFYTVLNVTQESHISIGVVDNIDIITT